MMQRLLTLVARHRHVAALLFLNVLMLGRVPVVGDIAALLFLFVLPGLVLTRAMGWRSDRLPAERLLHIVGTSIAVVLAAGLLANTALPLLGVAHPLARLPVLGVLDVLLLAGIAAAARWQPQVWTLQWRPRPGFPWRYGWLAIFPLLAAGGANTLNNGGSNWLVLVFIAGIVGYVLVLFVRKRELDDRLLLASLYAIGLGLLFMTSLRGWHITGYDIHQELQVFHLTQAPLRWSMAHLRDPYNACLSITMLPTMVAQLTHVRDEYIFKLLFQFIFALAPMAVYALARRFVTNKTAFLATFFFMAQVWFFQGMPALIRQEFGMLFFMLMLLTLFDERLRKSHRYQLAGLYGAAMVVSHYSTTYVAIALLMFVYGLNGASRLRNRWRAPAMRQRPVTLTITLPFIAFLVGGVLVWNLGVTKTSSGLTHFLDESSTNISQTFSGTTLTNALDQVVYPYPRKVNFGQYEQNTTAAFRRGYPGIHFYNQQQTMQANSQLHLVSFRDVRACLGGGVRALSGLGFKLLKMLINNVFILVGTVYLWWRWRKWQFETSEYMWLGVAGFVLLALMLLLPEALKEYNLERLYFQLNTVWAVGGVLGGLLIASFIRDMRWRYAWLAGAYCVQLLFYSGFIFNFTGGPALIAMNNYGEDYEKFYTHDAEVSAAAWLGANYHGAYIFTNSPGRNKLWAYGTIDNSRILTETLPSTIGQGAFVYETYLNTVGGKAMYTYNGDEYGYTYPQTFLDQHKDEVYSSGAARIYK